jgi:hypothetical protein
MARRDPPWRFDWFKNPKRINWGGGGWLEIQYSQFQEELGTGPIAGYGDLVLHLPWTATPLNLSAAGEINLSYTPPGGVLVPVLHKNEIFTDSNHFQSLLQGFCYINMTAVRPFAVAGKFHLEVDTPACGFSTSFSGVDSGVFDSRFGTYENNLAHPFTTGNPLSPYPPTDPRSVMIVPHPCSLEDANWYVENVISPPFAIYERPFTHREDDDGSWEMLLKTYKKKPAFTTDAENIPTFDETTRAHAVGTTSNRTGQDTAHLGKIDVKYSDLTITVDGLELEE